MSRRSAFPQGSLDFVDESSRLETVPGTVVAAWATTTTDVSDCVEERPGDVEHVESAAADVYRPVNLA